MGHRARAALLPGRHLLLHLLLLHLHLLLPLTAALRQGTSGCGWPGRPAGGRMVVQREGFLLPAAGGEEHSAGDRVVYSCPAPGEEVVGATTRTCGEGGAWRPGLPYCGRNLALGGRAILSAPEAPSEAGWAADGKDATCARTPRTESQRWWQGTLARRAAVRSVRIRTEGPVPALTVFVIELLPTNRTLYKPCGRHSPDPAGPPGAREVEVTCGPGDAAGHFVFLRDDRKAAAELVLCEVRVLGSPPAGAVCGEPELPAGAVLAPRPSGRRRVVTCAPGLHLQGGGSAIHCQAGGWNSTGLRCLAPSCPPPPAVEGAWVEVFGAAATYSCRPGFVLWGRALACQDGRWRGELPSCAPLSCGPPPLLPHATHSLSGNSTYLVGEVAVYACSPGFLLVVNSSSAPVARARASAVCGEEGWSATRHFSCIDASQLDPGTWLTSASLSINIIYILLALLTVLTVPLLLLHCCGRRLCAPRPSKAPDEATVAVWRGVSEGIGPPPSPPAVSGLYSVSSGLVIQPATISPSTLRSLSSSSNTFKPFSYTSAPAHSAPWQATDGRGLAFRFDSPLVPEGRASGPVTPAIDEAGYASLISLRAEPVYEPVVRAAAPSPYGPGNTYDSVPPLSPAPAATTLLPAAGPGQQSLPEPAQHLYANTQSPRQTSTGSYPDLLEMVRRSPSPQPAVPAYARVDLSRKRSRPSSEVSQPGCGEAPAAPGPPPEGVPGAKDSLDSYTRTLIDRFNSFLETEGHSGHRRPM